LTEQPDAARREMYDHNRRAVFMICMFAAAEKDKKITA
jgi:hypothetical protein